MTTLRNGISDYVGRVNGVLESLDIAAVERAIQAIIAVYDTKGTVFVCGNGGSATTATHMSADLGKNSAVDGKPRLRVIGLADNMSWFSALANDLGYENVFV